MAFANSVFLSGTWFTTRDWRSCKNDCVATGGVGAVPKSGVLGKVDALRAAVALVALLLLVTLVAGAVC